LSFFATPNTALIEYITYPLLPRCFSIVLRSLLLPSSSPATLQLASYYNNTSNRNRESKGNNILYEAAAKGKVNMVIYNTIGFLDVLKMLLEEQIQDLTPN
jgi:hypothetical protein